MSMLIPDIDQLIASFSDLPELAILSSVNTYFYSMVSQINLVKQWRVIKVFGSHNTDIPIIYPSECLLHTCQFGYIEYADYLVKKYPRLTYHFTQAFYTCCEYNQLDMAKYFVETSRAKHISINISTSIPLVISNGYLEMAKWIVQLEHIGYDRLISYYNINDLFQLCCDNNRIDMAKWLVYLGENGYGKICLKHEMLKVCCNRGYNDMAKWLIWLGESDGYSKFNIHTGYDQIYRQCYIRNKHEMCAWLIHLGKNCGYVEYSDLILKKLRVKTSSELVDHSNYQPLTQ